MLTPNVVAAVDPNETIDFAAVSQRTAWLRHPVYGDPSFDSFRRAAGNPIHRGAPPLEWPVNGFLFEDPRSGNWYVYAGHYSENYVMGEGKAMTCTVYRSEDRGMTWKLIGPIFPDEPFCFEGLKSPVGYAPDVSVVYADNRYHLVYDWATANSTWATQMNPSGGADNGIGYAWSERPEGPFIRTVQPVYRTGLHPVYRGKYRRGYAATLLRRKHDWLVLAMTDSGPHFSWALIGMAAASPEGPYSGPVFLRCVDDRYFHPPLLEFYPAFQHDGHVYAPTTSVALNRNFQAVFRAKTEEAMNPNAWELFQHGSVWHAAPVENEYYGIWGQTFSGFVGADGVLRAMFPSRDEHGFGTINIASRPWNAPYRSRGFTLSGHRGASLTLLKRTYSSFTLEAAMKMKGQVSFLWGYAAPLGCDRPAADSTLHALSLTRYWALELTSQEWRIVRVDDAGARQEIASGRHSFTGACAVTLTHAADGTTHAALDGGTLWSGSLEPSEGGVGILAAKNSHMEVDRFALQGASKPTRFVLLHTDALLGAGQAETLWKTLTDARFRYGAGAISQHAEARAKWNFDGTGFSLWAPRDPAYGTAEVFVNGVKAASLSFRSDRPEPSQPLLTQSHLPGPYHAVTVEVTSGTVPLDVLEVEN